MKNIVKLALGALAVGLGFWPARPTPQGLKEAKDVHIAFVVHGSASDPYWSVVKRGVDDAAALTGAKVEYYAPQVFDVVEQARLMDAAIATKPDGIAVSIADADAMRKSVTAALAADIPIVVVDSGEKQGAEMGTTLYVGTVSEYDSGKKAGERLAKEGILKVVCINHEVGNVSLDERCNGLNDGLKPSGGGTEVVAVTPDPADVQRRTEAYLSAHPGRAGGVRARRHRGQPADPDVPRQGAVRQDTSSTPSTSAPRCWTRSSPARWASAWTPSNI